MSALLKEHYHSTHNEHVKRIDRARWAGVAADLRVILAKDGAFKKREVEAIVASIMDIVERREPLTAAALESRLHAKQFTRDDAKAVAAAIISSYG